MSQPSTMVASAAITPSQAARERVSTSTAASAAKPTAPSIIPGARQARSAPSARTGMPKAHR